MGVYADWQIRNENIIEGFCDAQNVDGIISYGVSSYGYDLRTDDSFELFSATKSAGGIIDPKNFKREFLENVVGDVIIPPNCFALTRSKEWLNIPRDVIAIVLGKSTYARCGIIVNVTPLEPEWHGRVTIEISNTTSLPAKIYANEGIAQVLFVRADAPAQVLMDDLLERVAAEYKADGLPDYQQRAERELLQRIRKRACERSYADKKGRYQGQGDCVALPCVRGQSPIRPDGTSAAATSAEREKN